MRIERIRIDAFGRLEGFDSGPETLPGLVVVLGPNEAGKSTLFRFLATMLYGFHPATREGNPYSPWNGAEAAGGVRVRLDGGGCAEVARQLKSQPSGQLTAEGSTTELRNRALPWVQHVPPAVFDQVFAMTLRELAGLDAETWASIQDRLIGSMGASDLRPARAVADELENEAGKLWRPHRRGNQRVRDLQDEIRALRARRREASDRDRELRRIAERLEQARRELAEARATRARLKVSLERVEELAPVRAQLRRIAALREEAGDPGRLDGLPASPRAHLDGLRRRVEELEARVHEVEARVVEARAVLDATDRRAADLLRHAERVRSASARLALGERRRRDTVRAQLDDVEHQLSALDLFAVPWSEVPRGPLAALSLPDVRGAVRESAAARGERRMIESATPAGSPASPLPALVTGGLGLVALWAGSALDLDALQLGGVVVTAVAATLLAMVLRARGAGPGQAERVRLRESEARERLGSLVRDLPVDPRLLDQADEGLALELERAQALMRAHERASVEHTELERAVATLETDVALLRRELAPNTAASDEEVLAALRDEIARADRDTAAAASAERELARLEEERARLEGRLAEAREEQRGLERRLVELGSGRLDAGIATCESALAAASRADQLMDELTRAHPDLEELEQRISAAESAGEPWTLNDHDRAEARAELERLDDRIVELASSAEALDRDIVHMSEQETVDSVDGEIEALSAEQARLARERDRLWVMAQLIREADRRFREEHQPDVIRRASAYLEHLTDGRYTRVLADESDQGGVFRLDGPDLAGPVRLGPPLSTGTLEQAYLSLRLAIIDHLDRGGERLPLFIDEAFVNWDRARRGRGMDVLGAISRARQAFVFTCHEHVAAPLRDAGARVLDLGRE